MSVTTTELRDKVFRVATADGGALLMEQRNNIKFSFISGKSVLEADTVLKENYGGKAVTLKCVSSWFKHCTTNGTPLKTPPRVEGW